jgi:RNA polymerase sigma-70 factor (ECF subfamily)
MLYERFFSDMMSVCLRYGKDEDDAKDILQKGFIKVFGKFSMFNGEGTLRGWIQSIMVHTAIDHYRRQQRETKAMIPDSSYWEEAAEASVEADMAAEEILKIIQKLPHIQRAVFNLFALEGYSHKEIATELNITEGTSKWYLCEARKALKKMLAPVYQSGVKEYAA